MKNYLLKLATDQKDLKADGIYSVCSSNRYVLKASLLQACKDNSHLLIEPTVNQVNQYGGYTGRTPADFVDFISSLVDEVGFPADKLLLGGDHLGPNPWKNESSEEAMKKSRALVRAYVRAGFKKIHLDTSMPCADDDVKPGTTMSDEIVAGRAAELCEIAEKTHRDHFNGGVKPVYVIGTEVPIPGGAEGSIHDISVTSVASASDTMEITRQAFRNKGLEEAWQRVIAQVVQPGVEFGNGNIVQYDPRKASALSAFIRNREGMMFEAHSTDYQPQTSLRALVTDGFAILKVGPWLTFSFREAIFSLALIEKESLSSRPSVAISAMPKVLDQVMVNNPESWKHHYQGDEERLRFLRRYSYSDRSRYYWQHPLVKEAIQNLFRNLETYDIPLPLLSQYLPNQYKAITQGLLESTPRDIVLHKIGETLGIYARATRQAS